MILWHVTFKGKLWGVFQTFEEAREFANKLSNFPVNDIAAIKVTR